MLSNLSSFDLLIQAVGFLGFGLYILSFQILKPRRTILLQSFSNVILTIHFWGLGNMLVMFIAFIAAFRDCGSAFAPQKIQRLILLAFLLTLYSGAFFLVDSWIGICAIIGSTLATISHFFRDHFYIYRLTNFGFSVSWLIVYGYIFSIPGIIFAAFTTLSNLVGIARYMLHMTSKS